ncbi:ABC transporter substrate-binding protein, partial [Lysinibacillus fusiformis]|uniref:ABC transporter substrate-binding protein n=1 Tax=Lysinibacillus fusiformis TaxID=28031 RepID=UPI0020BE2AA7
AVPSEAMKEKMKEEKLLIPLDKTKIPNFKNIDPYFLDLPFDDDNKYSVPYFWGTVGIVYNASLVGDLELVPWDDLC